jgi:hypothetical protein
MPDGHARPDRLVMIERNVCICGSGHDGTTLLATILATDKDVYVPFEGT